MPDTPVTSTALLTVQDLEVCFTLKRSSLFVKPPLLRAVDGVTLSVRKGQTMGIVGESGSGKTTLALAVARLLPVTRGQIHLNGVDLLSLRGETLRNERHHMQFIFQDPYSSLNPRLRLKRSFESRLIDYRLDPSTAAMTASGNCLIRWACATTSNGYFRINFPAASDRESVSPGPLPLIPAWSSATNRYPP